MTVPRLSQETLAEMVGTTRSRVSFFMNQFRKLGFINYDLGDNLRVHSSLLNVLLRDDDGSTLIQGARTQAALSRNGPRRPASPANPSIESEPRGRRYRFPNDEGTECSFRRRV